MSQPELPAVERLVSAWSRLGLLGPLALAAFLCFWRLDQNGFGQEYYSAGVKSATQSWHNFFFMSFDPAGFIALDKPPLAFWFQALSARVFGFSTWSVLGVQGAATVASIAVLHHLVRRRFGPLAGFIAALALALSPVTVAIGRSNHPDAVLILLMLLAAWAATLATETGSVRWIVLTPVLVGLAFNVKTLQALLVLPAVAAIYLVGARGTLAVRLGRLGVAGVVLVAVSSAWIAAVDLTPKTERPHVGSSSDDTERGLVFGYNGLGRLSGQGQLRVSAAASARTMRSLAGRPSVVRLVNRRLGGQTGWLLPVAAASLITAAAAFVRRERHDPQRGALILWGTWAGTHAILLSFARGIIHPYYTAALAPAVAALTGIGIAALIRESRERPVLVSAAGLVASLTAALHLSFLSRAPDWNPWLRVVVAASAAAAFLLAAAIVASPRRRSRLRPFALGACAASISVGTVAWAFTPLAGPGASLSPRAGPGAADRAASFGYKPLVTPMPPAMLDFLEAGRGGATFLVATTNALQAADLIVTTGEAVMSIGGYLGNDPVPTRSELERYLRSGELRYLLLPGNQPPGPSAAGARDLRDIIAVSGAGRMATDFARSRCRLVAPMEYGNPPSPSLAPGAPPPLELYDCRTFVASKR